MIFTSFTFLVFFCVVFLVYHVVLKDRTNLQNILLLAASYFFYGYADWRMLPILLVATVVYYVLGISMERLEDKKASIVKTIGVLIGILVLGYFKYFNFFVDSFASILTHCGINVHPHTFNIIMPLGISFFTFRLLSYVMEINRKRISACRNFVNFATYVAFFLCILSGPIDRPNTFLPQLEKKRVFNYSLTVDGCRQILWGVFKKVVIADNLATYVDPLWSNIEQTSGSALLLGIVLYYIQLYADFSGYTDIAIGMSKTLGLRISNNFKTPLFALNIADYWKRWHISLTSWLTDYIFMPLNVKYRDAGKWGVVLAIMVTFTVSGLWHGANWTYVLWGVYHGLLYIPLILLGAFYKKAKIKPNRLGLPVLKDVGRMLLTTTLVVVGLILFRAPDVHTAWSYVCGICSYSLLSVPNLISYFFYIPMIISMAMMIVVEWFERKNDGYPSFSLFMSNRFMRWGFYILLLCMILVWGAFNNQQYIYFQF